MKQKAVAEQRAAALEAELLRLRMATAPPPQAPAMSGNGNGNGPATPPDEPNFDRDFANNPDYPDPYTSYLQAWARWDNARQLDERFERYQQQQAVEHQRTVFEHRLREGAQQYPDWQRALTEADTLGLQVSAVMRDAITASPRAADLVYYLAQHPEECMSLAEDTVMTHVDAAPIVRRLLEEKLGARVNAPHSVGTAPRPVVSTAKPPVSPVGSSPVASDDPPGESASAAEHARYWNRRLKVPGTR